MNKLIFTFLIITLPICGQIKVAKDHYLQKLTCINCHLCDFPTKQSPCLKLCPREDMKAITQRPEKTPVIVTLDKIENIYLPVSFSHRIHAQMSQMAGGCESCHHFNTVGAIQKCESCHELEVKRDDYIKPSLKRAYHLQCMNCHREWSHETDCNSCHTLKKNIKDANKDNVKKKYERKDHPKVQQPTKILYQTNSDKGKLVTFYHDDHTDKFGYNCTSCHKQESCTKCHDVRKASEEKIKPISTGKTFEEQHKRCVSCHSKNESCTKCHSDKETKPFDHGRSSGWALKNYHAKLSCNSCHESKRPFSKMDNNCLSCHKDWNNTNFKHSVTGFQLDETHSELNCEDCHLDNNFAVKPSCTNCHENYFYPKIKPGKLVKK